MLSHQCWAGNCKAPPPQHISIHPAKSAFPAKNLIDLLTANVKKWQENSAHLLCLHKKVWMGNGTVWSSSLMSLSAFFRLVIFSCQRSCTFSRSFCRKTSFSAVRAAYQPCFRTSTYPQDGGTTWSCWNHSYTLYFTFQYSTETKTQNRSRSKCGVTSQMFTNYAHMTRTHTQRDRPNKFCCWLQFSRLCLKAVIVEYPYKSENQVICTDLEHDGICVIFTWI